MINKDKFEIDIDDVVRRYADIVYRLAILNSKYKYEAEDILLSNIGYVIA